MTDALGRGLIKPGVTMKLAEGQEMTASVRLTRRPESTVVVAFHSPALLEVAAPSAALRFTPEDWNLPKTVTFRSHHDGVRDGNHRVPIVMTTRAEANSIAKAVRNIWVNSIDSGVSNPATPVSESFQGTMLGSDGKTIGSVLASYDSLLNRGMATFRLVMSAAAGRPREQVVTVGYSIGSDNWLRVESVEGIAASRFRWDGAFRRIGADRGLFGTVSILQPRGMPATMTMTAAAVPDTVQNLAVTPTGVGSLMLTWTPPEGGATSYTVTMTATTTSIVNGTTTFTETSTTSTTTKTQMPFTGLSVSPFYTFSIVANNAAGSGAASTVVFGPQTVQIESSPMAMINGDDGSIWVVSSGNSTTSPGTLQQIVKENGVWVAQSPITVGYNPYSLTKGLDGSIWVENIGNVAYVPGNVQQVVNDRGTWVAQSPIEVGVSPSNITTGLDGSIWVVNSESGTAQQIMKSASTWTARPAIAVGEKPWDITAGLDGSIWVTNYGNGVDNCGVRQIVDVDGTWTVQPLDRRRQ